MLHQAVSKLEEEKEVLEMKLRQTVSPGTGCVDRRLESENRELKRMLAAAKAEKDSMQKARVSEQLDKPRPNIFDDDPKIDRNFMMDSARESFNGSLYFD